MAGEIETLDLIGDLPPSWKVARFGDVLEGGTRNGIYKSKKFHGRGAKVVNMGELFANPRLRDVPMKRVELSDSEIEKSCLKQGDLLFARRSIVAEGAGKCIVVAEIKEPTTFESSIIRARPNPQVADSLFLYYLFNSPYGAYVLLTIRRQVAVSGITGTDLVELPLPLPPLAEQKAIAAVLGALDDKIELNRRMNATLEAMARALFQSWFVDFDPVRAKLDGRYPINLDRATAALFPDSFDETELGHIPHGWETTTLGEACEQGGGNIQTGPFGTQLHASDYVDEGIPSIMPSDLRDNRIETSSIARIREEDAERLKVYRVQAGDVVYSRRGDVERRSLIRRKEDGWLCGTGCLRVRFGPHGLNPFFGASYLGTSGSRAWVVRHAVGATMPNLNTSILGALPMVVPPPELQSRFAEIVGPWDERGTIALEESRTLATIRDTLLPKLLSGELSLRPDHV
jgi:type I restriction enzyme S subunit